MKILQNGKFNVIGLYEETEEVKTMITHKGEKYVKAGFACVPKVDNYTVAVNYKKM